MINNSLELDNVLEKCTSTISDFANDLNNYLKKVECIEKLNKLPWYTTLHFLEFNGDFAKCLEYDSKKIYYVPKSNIKGTLPEPGEAMKILPDCNFYVDYTGIPLK